MTVLTREAPPDDHVFEDIADAMPHMLWLAGTDGGTTYHNRRILEYAGLPAGITLGTGWERLVHPDDVPTTLATWLHSVRTGEPFEIEYRLRRHDGAYRWFLARAHTQLGGHGEVVRWVGTCTDIEDQKGAENRFRAIIEKSFDAIDLVAADGTLVYSSPSSVRLLGVPVEEQLGRDAFELLHPDDHDAVRALFGRLTLTPGASADSVHRARHADGRYLWLEFRATNLLFDPDVRAVVVNFRDVSDRVAAEEAVRESERRYRELFEANPHPMWVYDTETLRFLAVNDAAVQRYGYARDEFLAMTVADIRPPEDVPALRADILEPAGRLQTRGVWRHRWKDGTLRDVEVAAHSQTFGSRPARLVLALDVTDRLRAEGELRHTAELLKAVADGTTDAVFVKDRDGKYLLANPATGRLVGMSPEEVIGRDDTAIFDPDGARALMESDRRVMASDVAETGEEELTAAGVTRTYLATKAPYRDAHGSVVGVVGISRDITERKSAEEAVRRSERNFATLAEKSLQGLSIFQGQKLIYANPAQCANVGYTVDELRAMSRDELVALVHPLDRPAAAERAGKRLAGEDLPPEFELRIVRKDGATRWNRVSNNVVEFDGQPAILSTSLDITQWKQAEAGLTMFRALVDHTDDAFEVIDPETGRFLDVNDKACVARGYTRAEYLSMRVADLDLNMSGPGAWARRADLIRRAGSSVFEGQHRRRDGSVFPVEVSVTYVRLDRDYLLAVVRDITERKRAEEEVRRSERLLRQVLDALPTGVAVTDLFGDILLNNPAAERIWGRMIVDGAERCATSKGWWHGTGTRIAPDEWASVRAADGHASFNEVIDIETFDGTRKVIKNSASPIRDDSQAVTGVVIINEDVTEVLLLEEQFRQAQKMDAFGQLAGGVAHDFNNLLTIINGYSDIVLDSLPPGDPNRELLAEVHKAGQRSAGLTRQLLAFSRQQVLAPRVLDLNVVVGDTASMLRRVIGEDVKLSTTTAGGLWPVKADPGQVEQILLNLAVNARDAMPTGGKLTIETGNVVLDETYAASHTDAGAGSHVLLAVSDSGCGMSAAVRAKIFEPFFTTKGPGKGTGLGLATVYGIVKQTGGHIDVYSEVGVGTTFKVYLPRTEQTGEGAKSLMAHPAPPRGTETVLLLEDDAAVRALTLHILQNAGYAVLEAGGGDEALQVASGHTGRIHLLVTDVVMPGLGGWAAAERLAERHPGLRVLFMSGYTDDAVVRHGVLHDKVNFLQKPFTPAALAWKVREVLDQPST
jgi:two-component system cell cycle sensor histidine kinase/response regulator CckA